MNRETTVLVVGRQDWNDREIDILFDDRRQREGTLRIYSQEMFLAHMAAHDPFLAPAEAIEEFKRGHAALEFVASGWTGWVQPWIRGVSASGEFAAMSEISPLRFLGYRVGANGLDESQRRVILKRAFEQQLPFIHSEAYMKEWDVPRSSGRLKKIAELLASLCRSHIRLNHKTAVNEWTADLLWLKETIYLMGHHSFHWPDEFIG